MVTHGMILIAVTIEVSRRQRDGWAREVDGHRPEGERLPLEKHRERLPFRHDKVD